MAFVTETGDIIAKIILNDREYTLGLQNVNAQTQKVASQLTSTWAKEAFKMEKDWAKHVEDMARKTTENTGKAADAKAKNDQRMIKSNQDAAEKHVEIADKASRGVMDHWIQRFGMIAIGFTIWYRAINALEAALGKLKDEVIDTIRVIDDFEKETLGAAAAMASFAETDDPFTTYSQVLPIVRKQMNELEIVAARHLVTAEELRLAYASFIKKGVFPVTGEDIRNLATMSDAIKLFAREAGGVQQIQQEIFSLMEGQRGKGRELVYVFQAMYPELKDQIDAWKQMGKDIDGNNVLLKQLANSVAGLKAAQKDIYKLYQTQISSLETYWNLIKRIGGEVTYRKIAEDLRKINEGLIGAEGPSERLLDLAEEWHILMSSIYRIMKSILQLLNSVGPILQLINRILQGWSGFIVVITGAVRTMAVLQKEVINDIKRDIEELPEKIEKVVDIIKESFGDLKSWFMIEPTMKLFPEGKDLNLDPLKKYLKDSLKDAFTLRPEVKDKIVKIWKDVESSLFTIFEYIKSGIDENLVPDARTVEEATEKALRKLVEYYSLRDQLARKAGYDAVAIAKLEAETFMYSARMRIESLKLEEDEYKILINLWKEAVEQTRKDIVTLDIKQQLKKDTIFYRERLNLAKGFSHDFRQLEKADLDIFVYTKRRQWQILEREDVLSEDRYQQLLQDLNRYYEERSIIIDRNEERLMMEQYETFNSMRISYMRDAGYAAKDIMREEADMFKVAALNRLDTLKWEHRITKNQYDILLRYIERAYYKKIQRIDGTLKDGMAEGWKEFFEDLGTTFEKGVELTKDLGDGMYQGLKSGFFDLAKDEIEDFGDFFEAMLDNMLSAVADYIAKVTTELLFGELFLPQKTKGEGVFLSLLSGAGSLLGGLFGGGGGGGKGAGYLAAKAQAHGGGLISQHTAKKTLYDFSKSDKIFVSNVMKYHSGGLVTMQNIPRAHGGTFIGDLKPREVPIIAEEGETVLPRGMSPTPQPTIVNIMATDAASFYDLAKRNPRAITDQLVRALDSGDKQVISKLRSIF